MKKIIALLLVITWFSAMGQKDSIHGYEKGIEIQYSRDVKTNVGNVITYTNEVGDILFIDENYIFYNNLNIMLVNGYRLNRTIFLGGVVGLNNEFGYRNSNMYIMGQEIKQKIYNIYIPIMARVKIIFHNNYTSPFFMADIGCRLRVASYMDNPFNNNERIPDSFACGFVVSPGIGIDIPIAKKYNLSLIVRMEYKRTKINMLEEEIFDVGGSIGFNF